MNKFWICLFCWSVAVVMSHAQTGGVEGMVIDAETQQPLPFAHVFINNTTHVTTTDADGHFKLQNLPVGQVEIVSTFVGYESSQSKVSIKPGEVSNLSLQLKPSLQQLSEVTVKESKDKVWEKNLTRFQKLFLGTVTRSECVIKNPWVIDFSFQDGNRIFIATATEPIEIENYSLGYRLFFYLKNFQTDGDSYVINGNAYFKEMEDRDKLGAWQKARDAVYLGSERHLFRSLLNQTAASEGFRLYIDKAGASDINNRPDIFYPEVGVKVLEYKPELGSISPTAMPNEYVIQVQGRTEVHYLKKPGTTRLYKDMPGQVSWLEVRGNRVRVNGQGVILNPGDVVFSGESAHSELAVYCPSTLSQPTFHQKNPEQAH